VEANIEIWLPVPPAFFAAAGGIILIYLIYVSAKFVISLWTGA